MSYVDAIRSWWTRQVTWKTLFVLFMGQLVSFVLALVSFSSSLIATLGVDAPITQTTFSYLCIAIVFGAVMLLRGQKLLVITLRSWYWYLLLDIVDVEGNFLVNKAHQFSSLTSVTLLDCWTIPWGIILTYFLLGSRYSLWQNFGAVVSIGGLVLILVSDSGVGGGGGGKKPVLRDVLVIVGTVFFALSNVGEILAFVGFTVASFMFYTLTPFVLKVIKWSCNVQPLNADVGYVGNRFSNLFVQATVVIGLAIYTTTGKDPVTVLAIEDGNQNNTEYQLLPDTDEEQST
ncbi:uncharacterized protein [Rutidosis leptorrhynchoides]|uniref:uncharacterized protein n=1 Tax=Rutidosis leptorrhynchoides TaxID=125765 RepID=UPI003A9A0461